MDQEEILAKSRAENRGQDEREKAAMSRAGQVASAVGGLVCALIRLLNVIFDHMGDTSTFVVWAVYLSITGTSLLVKYRQLRKPHELAAGLAQVLLAAVFFVLFVLRLVR